MLVREVGPVVANKIKDEQLSNLVQRTRKAVKPEPLSIGGLKQFCEDRVVPANLGEVDQHQVLVAVYEVSDRHVYILMTSKRLMDTCVRGRTLQTDATFKLNWEGLPVILTGVTDANRVFHACALHIVWKAEDTAVYTKVNLVACFRTVTKITVYFVFC